MKLLKLIQYLEQKKKECAYNICCTNISYSEAMKQQGKIKAYQEIINYINNIKE